MLLRICPTVSQDGAADDLFCIMQQAYHKDSCRHKFVQSVNTAREPAIVVSTDLQLQDLTRFCTLASPLMVDPTFCLDAFDMTLITFHHLFLQTNNKGAHLYLMVLHGFITREFSYIFILCIHKYWATTCFRNSSCDRYRW